MHESDSWLSEGGQRKSKFINQRIRVGEEFIGIYKAKRRAVTNFGQTYHYVFDGPTGELIFDSKNPLIFDIFSSILFGSRVRIEKTAKNGRLIYTVKCLNTLEDEAAWPKSNKDKAAGTLSGEDDIPDCFKD